MFLTSTAVNKSWYVLQTKILVYLNIHDFVTDCNFYLILQNLFSKENLKLKLFQTSKV